MSFERVRRQKNESFTTIDNFILRDQKLSLKAKALMVTIMGLPETWDFSINGIIAVVKEGREAIYSALRELQIAGYVECNVVRDKGRFVETIYVFHERPLSEAERPHTENPHTVKPDAENQQQLKKQGIKETLNQDTTNATRPLRGRAGIPKNLLPLTTSSSELNIWLDAVAVAVGAKDRHALPKFTKWERACMTAVREQHDLHIFLQVIEAEKKRNEGQEEFFSPDTCLQKLQLSKAKAATTDGGKWMH